jgi:hypothetical protein
MIFPIIESDDVVQVNDKFRISADKSYKTPDESAWTLVEIEPYAGFGFIDVTGDITKPKPEKYWFLDFQYSTPGAKVVTVRMTTNGAPVTFSKTVTCLTAAEDNLFSTDELLKEVQEDILRLLPDGRATFKYKHRAAQNFILDWLWNNGYFKTAGFGAEPYLKADIVDVDFISDWATYVCLRMLYSSNQSQGGDVFRQKAGDFLNEEQRAREKVLLKLDTDGDGELSPNEGEQIQSRRLIRV